MKRIILLSLLGILSVSYAFAQPCVNDVWMSLRNKQIGKAKKIIDECVVANSESAEVWLMRGNVYLQRFSQEEDNLKKNPSYVVKDPDAVWIANESFYKALQLDNKVEPRTGMMGPLEGQILCAGPLYAKGRGYLEKGDFENAEKYLVVAARNFKLDAKNPDLSLYLSYIYSDMAYIAAKKNDAEAYKKALVDGTNTHPSTADLYLMLYDVYKNEKDTANAEKILNAARKNVPDSLSKDIYAYEIGHYAMINNVEKLNEASEALVKKFGETPENLALVAGYLNNSDQMARAEGYIKRGLEMAPNNFDLNQQMGYRYFFEAEKYQNRIDEALLNKEYSKVSELQAEEKVALENAHTWVEKAYQLNPNDVLNNRMLKQLKVKLRLEVPEALEQSLQGNQ